MDEDLLEEIREMIDNGCGTLEIFEYIEDNMVYRYRSEEE